MWIKFEDGSDTLLLNMDNIEGIMHVDKTIIIQFFFSGENTIVFDAMEEAREVLKAFEQALKGLSYSKRFGEKIITINPFRSI